MKLQLNKMIFGVLCADRAKELKEERFYKLTSTHEKRKSYLHCYKNYVMEES